MVWIGPTSSIFDMTTFALMWFVFSANSEHMQTLFQSGWFVEGLLSQTLVVHMLRKIPFIQSTAPAGTDDDRSDYGYWNLRAVLSAWAVGWAAGAAVAVLPVAGRHPARLLLRGAGHENVLHPSLQAVALILR